MILAIQTNLPGQLHIWLIQGNRQKHQQKKVSHHGSEKLLLFIEQVMKKEKVTMNMVSAIIVVRGPGPFTAVRSGLVVANTLGWLLAVPVLGQISHERINPRDIKTRSGKKYQPAKPWYGREPNITVSKQAKKLDKRAS